jgi:hypothetical protein
VKLGSCKRLFLRLAGVVVLLLALPAAAQAGQIVYAHGGDLWVMNDDGTGQRPLVTSAQAGVAIDYANPGDQPVSVQPGGTGVAFVAPPAGSCGSQASNCPGLYSLVDGKVTRLTAPSAPCGSATVICGSEEEEPAVTSDGRVVYQRLSAASAFICYYYCGFGGGYQEAYYVRRLDGSDAPVAWPVPPLPQGQSDDAGVDPAFEWAPASDPADPSILAYQGNFMNPGPNPGTPYYPLDIERSGVNPPTTNQPAYDDSFIYGLSFSQDGTRLADVETGEHKGIWVYPSGQSWQSAGSGASYIWALQDPDDGQGQNIDHYITGVTFVGNNELVFSANDNLYSLPARCWATSTSTTANCTMGDASQLTHDGTQSAPDISPAWTSSTTTIPAFSAGGGGSSAGGAPGGNTGHTGSGGPTTGGSGGTQTSRPNTRVAGKAISRRRHTASFRFSASGKASGFQCALVKTPKHRSKKASKPRYAACRSPKTYEHLGRGAYVFYVRAVNSAGPDLTPATIRFTL